MFPKTELARPPSAHLPNHDGGRPSGRLAATAECGARAAPASHAYHPLAWWASDNNFDGQPHYLRSVTYFTLHPTFGPYLGDTECHWYLSKYH
ncbi:hypothetical protein BDA96_03G189600 [Sorghum bicolor]|uniref:Uncharacterized protein n=1 Tax=Sorghum bicolor TaxID=4558 RepID=A0A921RFH2_SORBI|nr:hypothetical protein BDA96_03G189600 [Sorghum bicolor]